MRDILMNIREIRQNRGYSQDFVGKKLGLSQNGYSLIENGQRSLSYSLLNQIAIIFEMNVIDVITYPEKWTSIDGFDLEGLRDETKVVLQIELKKEKKEQVLKLAFGDNILEILNK